MNDNRWDPEAWKSDEVNTARGWCPTTRNDRKSHEAKAGFPKYEDYDANYFPNYSVVLMPRLEHYRVNPTPKHTIIYFHCWAGSGLDVDSFLPYLNQGNLSTDDFRIVAPTAPLMPADESSGGWQVNSWFYYEGGCDIGRRGEQELKHIRESFLPVLNTELERVRQTGGRLFLYGSSQGVSVATDMLLHCPADLSAYIGGVICSRGWPEYYSFSDTNEEELQEKAKHVKFFVFHGLEDAIANIDEAKVRYKKLERLGFGFTIKILQGIGHGTGCAEEPKWTGEFIEQIVH